jgi:UDP-N-acetylglucosamine acyltransferase
VAGHVEIGDQCFISGGVLIHQFSRLGRLCLVSGNTRVNLDIPPYFLVSEFDCAAHGLNVVGLRRAGLDRSAVSALKEAYRILYRSGLSREEALEHISALATTETGRLVSFIRSSERGICPDYCKARGKRQKTEGKNEE